MVTINWYQVFVSSISVITRMITDRVGLSLLSPITVINKFKSHFKML